MENINPDILSLIALHLNWLDTFNFRLLSKDINKVFKFFENVKMTHIKNP